MKGLRDQEALAQPTCGHHRPADWFESGQLKFFGFLEETTTNSTNVQQSEVQLRSDIGSFYDIMTSPASKLLG